MNMTNFKTVLGAIAAYFFIFALYHVAAEFFAGRANTTFVYAAIYYGILTLVAYKLVLDEPQVSIGVGMAQLRQEWVLLFAGFVGYIIMVSSIFLIKYWCDIIDISVMYSQFPELIAQRGLSELFIIFMIAPVVEELFFRHFIFGNIAEGNNDCFGAIFSSGLFAIVSMNLWQLPGLFIFGLIQCWTYKKVEGNLFILILNNIVFSACIFIIPAI